ncbi:unnamed protein product [Coccothraustes coccothraustes]
MEQQQLKSPPAPGNEHLPERGQVRSAVTGILRLARVNSRPRHRRVRPPSPHAKAAPEPPTRVTRQLLPRHGRAKAASTKPLPPLQAAEPSRGAPGRGRRPRGACQAPGPS